MKLQISGYLKLDIPPQGTTCVDDKNREHFAISRRGELLVVNRSDMNTTTIAEHVNDVQRIIKERSADKPILTTFVHNIMFYLGASKIWILS